MQPAAIYLRREDTADSDDPFPTTPWGAAWDRVAHNAKDIAGLYDICLPAVAMRYALTHIRPGLKLAVWCDSPETLSAARTSRAQLLVFAPSAVSMLDSRRVARQTLIVTTSIEKNEIIARHHIGMVSGGGGAGSDCMNAFMGARAAYDLKVGEAWDFGKIIND